MHDAHIFRLGQLEHLLLWHEAVARCVTDQLRCHTSGTASDLRKYRWRHLEYLLELDGTVSSSTPTSSKSTCAGATNRVLVDCCSPAKANELLDTHIAPDDY
jgi:hypothetical protein